MSTALDVARAVPDPELPVLTLADLGVLRDVSETDGRVTVTITPTYSGCPAMDEIRSDLRTRLQAAGYRDVEVRTVLSPAWTTDWITEEGKAKLERFGIAPPNGKAGRRALFGQERVTCPQCGSQETSRISEFGSTPCKALYRCTACAEPFDYFKCI